MNIATFFHFFPIIISYGRSLFCFSIMKILLILVVSSRCWLIIRWIMFSTLLPIKIWSYFTETMCLWNFYISANWWNSSTYCWPTTNNCNIFIFKRWFFAVTIKLFGRVWCTVKWILLLLLLQLEILKHNYFDNWQRKKKHN